MVHVDPGCGVLCPLTATFGLSEVRQSETVFPVGHYNSKVVYNGRNKSKT